MEDTLAGIKAFFEAQLGAELVAIGTERGVTVPAWKLLDTAELHDRQYPAIEILARTIEYDYGASENEPFLQPSELHGVSVVVRQAGSESKDVQNDLLRYAEGIRRVTNDDETYGDRFNWVRLVSMNFSAMRSERKLVLQTMSTDLRVRVIRETAG